MLGRQQKFACEKPTNKNNRQFDQEGQKKTVLSYIEKIMQDKKTCVWLQKKIWSMQATTRSCSVCNQPVGQTKHLTKPGELLRCECGELVCKNCQEISDEFAKCSYSECDMKAESTCDRCGQSTTCEVHHIDFVCPNCLQTTCEDCSFGDGFLPCKGCSSVVKCLHCGACGTFETGCDFDREKRRKIAHDIWLNKEDEDKFFEEHCRSHGATKMVKKLKTSN